MDMPPPRKYQLHTRYLNSEFILGIGKPPGLSIQEQPSFHLITIHLFIEIYNNSIFKNASCLPSQSRNSKGERCSSVHGWPSAPGRIRTVKCGTDPRPGFPQPLTLLGTSLYQLLEAAHKELRDINFSSRTVLEVKICNFGGKNRHENTLGQLPMVGWMDGQINTGLNKLNQSK